MHFEKYKNIFFTILVCLHLESKSESILVDNSEKQILIEALVMDIASDGMIKRTENWEFFETLSKDVTTKVFSKPVFKVLNNQTATVRSIVDIKLPKSVFGTINPVINYETQNDATVALSLTPMINNDNTITMYLDLSLDHENNKRNIKVEFVVESEKVMVLSQLCSDTLDENVVGKKQLCIVIRASIIE